MDWTVAEKYLSRTDPMLRRIIKAAGPCTLKPERSRQPWQALVRAVAHQQLNGKAAESIFARFLALYPDCKHPTPEQIAATPAKQLRSVGFSNAKVLAIHDIADKAAAGLVPTRRQCARMTDEEIIAALIPLRGVGRWTVEMLLMFTLGRVDVLPVDDFGVREGFRLAHGHKAQLKPKELAELGQAWAPHRTVAAWYWWRAADLYRVKKGT